MITYLRDKPDTSRHDSRNDKEQAKWDEPRLVTIQLGSTKADQAHNETAELQLVISTLAAPRRGSPKEGPTYKQHELISLNNKTSNLLRNNLGLEDGDNSQLHADVAILIIGQ